MDVKKENDKLIAFWNNAFSKVEPMTLSANDFDLSIDFNRLLKQVGDTCGDVLDIGCGWGYGLFAAKLLGNKMVYGLGIDPSENAVNIIEDTCENSDIDGIDAKEGTHELLSLYDDQSFDGIICSNTLDVVPEETSNEIIAEIKRLLKPQGLLLLKFNFILTEELVSKIGMIKIDENAYQLNDVLRGVNHETEEWLAKFHEFEVIEETSYQRNPTGPKDRVLLLKKRT